MISLRNMKDTVLSQLFISNSYIDSDEDNETIEYSNGVEVERKIIKIKELFNIDENTIIGVDNFSSIHKDIYKNISFIKVILNTSFVDSYFKYQSRFPNVKTIDFSEFQLDEPTEEYPYFNGTVICDTDSFKHLKIEGSKFLYLICKDEKNFDTSTINGRMKEYKRVAVFLDFNITVDYNIETTPENPLLYKRLRVKNVTVKLQDSAGPLTVYDGCSFSRIDYSQVIGRRYIFTDYRKSNEEFNESIIFGEKIEDETYHREFEENDFTSHFDNIQFFPRTPKEISEKLINVLFERYVIKTRCAIDKEYLNVREYAELYFKILQRNISNMSAKIKIEEYNKERWNYLRNNPSKKTATSRADGVFLNFTKILSKYKAKFITPDRSDKYLECVEFIKNTYGFEVSDDNKDESFKMAIPYPPIVKTQFTCVLNF